MEDEWTKLGDIGSMLPDVSEKVEDKKLRDAATNSFANSIKPLTAAAEDNLDFGGYQPSCVAKPPPSAGRRRGISPQENKTTRVNGIGILGLNAACTDIFAPKSGDNKNETNATQAKAEKVKDETAVFWEQPSGLFHEDSLDTKEVSKRNFQANLISSPLQQTEMLKVVHARELEARDNQLVAERALLTEHKISIENLSELIAKAREWSAKVESLEEAMVMEREHSSKDKHKWLESLENVCHQQAVSLQEWGRRSDDIFKKVEGIVETLEKGTREMEKDHTNLQGLQEAAQVERLQSLAEVTTTREKLEEVRNSCFQEKEEFLAKIMQERKELEIERENVLRMKEQLFHADAILEKQLLEHTFRMQTEAEEIFKQKLELEKAKEMAVEIAHEMENGRHEVEEQHKTFEQDGSYELDATLQYDQRKHQRFKDAVDVTSLHVHDMLGKAPRYLHKENEIPKLLSVLSKTLTPRTSTFSRVNASQLLQNNMRKKMNHGSKSIGSLLLKMPKSNNKKNKRANPDLATPPFNGGGEAVVRLLAMSGFNDNLFGPYMLRRISLEDPIEKIMLPYLEVNPLPASLQLCKVVMRFFRDNAVPVTDQWGNCIGIVHREDCTKLNVHLSSIMRSPPPHVTSWTSVGRVIALLLEHQYKMIVVVKSKSNYDKALDDLEERTVGFFTRERLFSFIFPDSDIRRLQTNHAKEKYKINVQCYPSE